MNRALTLALVLAGGCVVTGNDGADNPSTETGAQAAGSLAGNAQASPNSGGGGDESDSSDPAGSAAGDGSSSGPWQASGRAWGVSANVLDLIEVAPLPDTDIANPQTLLGIGVGVELCPLCDATSLENATLAVATNAVAAAPAAHDESSSTVDGAYVGVSDLLTLGATAIRAQTSALISDTETITSSAGSEIIGLTINGVSYGDFTQPFELDLLVADVKILETITTTTDLSASIAVNAIHVSVPLLAVDLIVGHAESHASLLYAP